MPSPIIPVLFLKINAYCVSDNKLGPQYIY